MEDYQDYIQPAAPDEEQPVRTEEKKSPFADSPYEIYTPPVEPAAPVREKKKKGNALGRVLAVLLSAAVTVTCCGITAFLVNRNWENRTAVTNQAMNNKLNALQTQINALQAGMNTGTNSPVQEGALTPGQVYAQNVQAVVAISNEATTNFYGQVSQTASSGSGFIISADGYVVSNYHVVQGATRLTVLTYEGTEHEAELVGYDATNDIALLKIQAENLPSVELGSSDAMAVGDQVVAIGNPLGELTSTLTVGYISAKDRVVTTDGTAINMMQTDAAINSGNSGGPLFNMQGQVIGITTAKYSGTSNSGVTIEGIGFAIPMDDVEGMLQDLMEHGYVTGAYLGVGVKDVEAAAQAYGLPAGAYVQQVTAGSAAEKAGIKAQDIIVNLGGYSVTSTNDLTRALRKVEAGQETTITVYRAGQEVDLSITPDEKPRQEQQQQQTQQETQQQVITPDYEDFFDQFDFLFPFFD